MSSATLDRKSLRSCREVLTYLGSGADPGLSTEHAATCAQLSILMENRPVIGLLLQQVILHRYLNAKGITDIQAEIDWKDVYEWFVQNIGTVVKALLTFFALFV